MFDSKAMVEHSEEQPASEAAMMASIMVGRASSSGSSSSGGGNPPKTVSQVCVEEKMIVGTVPKNEDRSTCFSTGHAGISTIRVGTY